MTRWLTDKTIYRVTPQLERGKTYVERKYCTKQNLRLFCYPQAAIWDLAEISHNVIFSPLPPKVREKSTASRHNCEITKWWDLLGLGSAGPNPKGPNASAPWVWGLGPKPKWASMLSDWPLWIVGPAWTYPCLSHPMLKWKGKLWGEGPPQRVRILCTANWV